MPPVRTSKGERAKCVICGNTVSRRGDLLRHMRTHDVTAKLPCPFDSCDFSTHQKTNLETHIRRHNGEKIFVCQDDPDCNFDTVDAASLIRHRKRTHGYIPGFQNRERAPPEHKPTSNKRAPVKSRRSSEIAPSPRRRRSSQMVASTSAKSPHDSRRAGPTSPRLRRNSKFNVSTLLNPMSSPQMPPPSLPRDSPEPYAPQRNELPAIRSPSPSLIPVHYSAPNDSLYYDSLSDTSPRRPSISHSPPHASPSFNPQTYVSHPYDSPPYFPQYRYSPPYTLQSNESPLPYHNYPPYNSPTPATQNTSAEHDVHEVSNTDDDSDSESLYSVSSTSYIRSPVSSVRSSLSDNGTYTTSAFMMTSPPVVMPQDVFDETFDRSCDSPSSSEASCESILSEDRKSFLFSDLPEPAFQLPYVQATYAGDAVTDDHTFEQEDDCDPKTGLSQDLLLHLASLLLSPNVLSSPFATPIAILDQPQFGTSYEVENSDQVAGVEPPDAGKVDTDFLQEDGDLFSF